MNSKTLFTEHTQPNRAMSKTKGTNFGFSPSFWENSNLGLTVFGLSGAQSWSWLDAHACVCLCAGASRWITVTWVARRTCWISRILAAPGDVSVRSESQTPSSAKPNPAPTTSNPTWRLTTSAWKVSFFKICFLSFALIWLMRNLKRLRMRRRYCRPCFVCFFCFCVSLLVVKTCGPPKRKLRHIFLFCDWL